MANFDKDAVLQALNEILELELAGVVRYMHYSFMVFGPARLPIVQMMRQSATESLAHAEQAGELITSLGGHPSLQIGALLETEKHGVMEILREALAHEHKAVEHYLKLNDLVKDRDIRLEEYARGMILKEQIDMAEFEKMLRHPDEH